ncbi:hypothetical protein LY90DRAFT_503347 [Neocallimastix californiae]|uniref:alpha-galactosidase n=1 Tax=Neocallimastix californiae TaxID=1754190 RepID=A0A1Y2EN20_9FUNG|nr:hypothetical protein LY90DRAFT_503347 [Neocallimastix californiae]|eukprot:ORY72960.1 hypothetical protein LY90DRAFT_503347 [Neocallimastix californiae]
MKFLLPVTILVSLIFSNVEARWKPTPGMTWNYVLGAKVDISSERAQVLDIDYETDASKIKQYHNAGKRVICYFSGGTIEKNRSDYKHYTAVSGLVKNTYGDWPDEKWLDFRKEGLKPLIINRMKRAINNGCDAIEVDNLDGYQISDVKDNWSNPLTKEDTVVFARWLGNTAHSLGISIGLKNIPGLISSVGSYFDFAINESCIHYKNECAMYKNFIRTGKPVFGITYGSFTGQLQTMCKELNGVGISMIVKKSQSLVQASTIFDVKELIIVNVLRINNG